MIRRTGLHFLVWALLCGHKGIAGFLLLLQNLLQKPRMLLYAQLKLPLYLKQGKKK